MLSVLLVSAVVFFVVYQEGVYHCNMFLVFAVISDCGLSFERVSLQYAFWSLQWFFVFLYQSGVYHCNMFLVFAVIPTVIYQFGHYHCNNFFGLCSDSDSGLSSLRVSLQYVFGLCGDSRSRLSIVMLSPQYLSLVFATVSQRIYPELCLLLQIYLSGLCSGFH